jgi:hypothetical protein
MGAGSIKKPKYQETTALEPQNNGLEKHSRVESVKL